MSAKQEASGQAGYKAILVTTTENIPGKKITAILGVAFGSCVQTKHLGKDIGAGLRSVVGGEAKGYSELVEESRRIATGMMLEQAQTMGADAVIAMRYTTTQTMTTAAEMVAYGTAVNFE